MDLGLLFVDDIETMRHMDAAAKMMAQSGLNFVAIAELLVASLLYMAELDGDHGVASARAVELLHNDKASKLSLVALYSQYAMGTMSSGTIARSFSADNVRAVIV